MGKILGRWTFVINLGLNKEKLTGAGLEPTTSRLTYQPSYPALCWRSPYESIFSSGFKLETIHELVQISSGEGPWKNKYEFYFLVWSFTVVKAQLERKRQQVSFAEIHSKYFQSIRKLGSHESKQVLILRKNNRLERPHPVSFMQMHEKPHDVITRVTSFVVDPFCIAASLQQRCITKQSPTKWRAKYCHFDARHQRQKCS